MIAIVTGVNVIVGQVQLLIDRQVTVAGGVIIRARRRNRRNIIHGQPLPYSG